MHRSSVSSLSSPTIAESHASSDRTSLVEYLLAEEIVAQGKDKSTKEWKSMLKTYEQSLDDYIASNSTCMLTSLSIACCIVGAGCTPKFNKAFCLLVSWEGIGGAYWVIQIELIRHYLLPLLMDTEITLDMCQIDQWLSTVEQCTANTRLKLAIAQLHSDITNLNNGLGIDEEAELYFSSGAHDAAKNFRDYAAEHPLDKFIPWCIDWMVASLSKAFTMQMSKAIPAVAPLSDFEIANMPATSKARDEGLPPQKLRRKYQRACTKATDNASLFANIVVLSYEDDTEDTTEMPETVKLASFLTRKLSGSHDEVEGKEEGEKQVSLASMPTRVGPTDITSESGNGQLDSHAHGGKIGDVCINTVHDLPSKDAVPLSQRSSIVSESSSDSYSDSDASIVSTDKPDSLFGMVQKAIWRVM